MSLTIGTAVVAAGALGAGAALYSSSQASKAQQNATNAADSTQLSMYDQTRTDNAPALSARNDALSKLEQLLGVGGNPSAPGYGSQAGPINPGDVSADPGYQFGLQQGQQALRSSETARGMSDSGAALKAASQYGTDYATTKYDDAFNREVTNRQQQLNPFLSLAGAGQVGATTTAQAGTGAANQISANQVSAGNSNAASTIAAGNIVANTGNQLAGWYQNYGGSNGAVSGFTQTGGGYVNNNPWAVGPNQG